MAVDAFTPNTQEAEAGRSLRSRTAKVRKESLSQKRPNPIILNVTRIVKPRNSTCHNENLFIHNGMPAVQYCSTKNKTSNLPVFSEAAF